MSLKLSGPAWRLDSSWRGTLELSTESRWRAAAKCREPCSEAGGDTEQAEATGRLLLADSKSFFRSTKLAGGDFLDLNCGLCESFASRSWSSVFFLLPSSLLRKGYLRASWVSAASG